MVRPRGLFIDLRATLATHGEAAGMAALGGIRCAEAMEWVQ